MTVQKWEPSEVLGDLLKQDGPFVSLYLPYGVRGADEGELAIERKNLLRQAHAKLKGARSQAWDERLSEIEIDLQHTPESADEQEVELPFTRIYFASAAKVMGTVLPTALRPHFSFAPYAEIEPLVYNDWAREPYWVMKLDPAGPSFLYGVGSDLKEVEVIVPQTLQSNFGTAAQDFAFERVIATADKNRNPGADLDQNGIGMFHGYSSRQTSKKQRNRHFWLQLVGMLCRESLVQRPGNLFVIGPDDLVRDFLALHKNGLQREAWSLGATSLHDKRAIMAAVREHLVHRKLEQADEEFKQVRHQDNLHDVVELVESGRTRKLFIQQDDWFADHRVPDDRYEFSNPRAVILAKALRNRAVVSYTKAKINNKHGLAALAY